MKYFFRYMTTVAVVMPLWAKTLKDNYADKGVKPVNTFAYIHFTF